MKKRKGKIFRRILAGSLVLSAVLCGCHEEKPKQTIPMDEGISGMRNEMIKDVYVNKARFDPGEKPVLTVEIQSETDEKLDLLVTVRQLTETVFTTTGAVELKANELLTTTVELELPETDFQGYSVEAYLVQDGKRIDWDMTAAEVASDWSKFPRYGYLTKYGVQKDEQIRATLERLNKHHITGLFYYDVLDCHQRPLAGTVGNPDDGWKTLSSSFASAETVSKLIDYGHEYNMNSYLYNLIFGAYDNYAEDGVDVKWGLFKDQAHEKQDYHGDFVDAWETKRIYLFNPANKAWQDYYLQVTKDVLSVYNYDGLQIDSLGGRGDLYDYDGNAVNLKDTYSSLLVRLDQELGTRVIFNPVSGYGQDEVMENVDYDMIYEEVWPWECPSYGALKTNVDAMMKKKDPNKGIVIAAYMNYNKSSGAFNPAGVLLTNATLMASGAGHLELGDTGMLKTEYYPGGTLRINELLEKALRNYYSFSVAYENYLRDASFEEVEMRTYINGKSCNRSGHAGKVWSFTKQNANGDQVVNFINLVGLKSDEWRDDYGKQKTPTVQTDMEVRHYLDEIPAHVYLASPDTAEGIMTELSFETGSDIRGKYITFTMPSLQYWNMIVIKQA